MIDVNYEAQQSLNRLDCRVVYQHPGEFTSLPVVSFYNIAEHGAFYSDNEEDVQLGYIQADVWTREPKECGDITIRLNDVMTADGWTREMSADVPERDGGIYHKTMRFYKYFTLEKGELDND